jgi:hypothetical protein
MYLRAYARKNGFIISNNLFNSFGDGGSGNKIQINYGGFKWQTKFYLVRIAEQISYSPKENKNFTKKRVSRTNL